MPVITNMLAILIVLGMSILSNGIPIADVTNSAQEREAFANNLLECVEESSEGITNGGVNSCLENSLNDLRPAMSTGIPSLGLKPTDPLSIKNLEIYRELPAISIQTKLTNVVVRGLSKFITRKVSADLKKKSIQIVITVPNLYIEGDYNTNSQLAIVRIEGEGPFTANLTKVTGDGRADIKVVERTIDGKVGQKILMIENATFDFNIAKATMKLENLFPGKKALAAVADKFLNSEEFTKMVQREVKPQILTEVNTLFEEVMNSALSQFPVNNYLEEIGYSE